MVNNFCFVYLGYYFVIFLCLRKTLGSSNNTEKTISKRQTDSFVVSANYGVQSGYTNNPTASPHQAQAKSYSYEQYERPPQTTSNATVQPPSVNTENNQDHLISSGHENWELLPDPSAWRGSNMQNFEGSPYEGLERHLQSDPSIYVTNAYQSFGVQPEMTATAHPYRDNIKSHSSIDNNENVMTQNLPSYGLSNFKSSKSYYAKSSTANEHHPDTSEDIIYGSINTPTPGSQWYSSNIKHPHERVDEIQAGYQENDILSETHKPSVKDLQQIISKIVKGATKVHQVVKVPAVYEIHLQEQDKYASNGGVSEDSRDFQVPLPEWTYSQTAHEDPSSGPSQFFDASLRSNNPAGKEQFTTFQPTWTKNKFSYTPRSPRPWQRPHQFPRGARQATKTWNLPSKINYFNNKPLSSGTGHRYGKYSYPKPFTSTKWESSGVSNSIPLDSWTYPKYSTSSSNLQTAPSYFGSVSVPMRPGSTAVTFRKHNTPLGNQNNVYSTLNQGQAGIPDLSLYYAKKKELENEGFSSSNNNKRGYRRNDRVGARGETFIYDGPQKKRSSSQIMYSPLNGMNYIIHVREKPSI